MINVSILTTQNINYVKACLSGSNTLAVLLAMLNCRQQVKVFNKLSRISNIACGTGVGLVRHMVLPQEWEASSDIISVTGSGKSMNFGRKRGLIVCALEFSIVHLHDHFSVVRDGKTQQLGVCIKHISVIHHNWDFFISPGRRVSRAQTYHQWDLSKARISALGIHWVYCNLVLWSRHSNCYADGPNT